MKRVGEIREASDELQRYRSWHAYMCLQTVLKITFCVTSNEYSFDVKHHVVIGQNLHINTTTNDLRCLFWKLQPSPPPYQLILGVIYRWIKLSEREADHPYLSRA